MTYRDGVHAPTEFKYIILSYPSISQLMVDSHCEILWDVNSVADLGRHPTASYAGILYNVEK